MSLIGPRPTLPHQVEQYSDREKRRLEMKPGITGWALVNGRNKLSWPERIKLDIWYIDHWSIWLDLKILFKTVWVVIFIKLDIWYIDHWSIWLDLKILFKTVWVVIFKREGIYGKDGVTGDYGR
jgi:lipopolysaccharide/colanic/teichoic acid biosynthesis glycosyltransferase